MKIAYFDCFSGAAGDMIIGSMLDSGLPLDDFKAEISKIGLSGYDLKVERVSKHRIAGTRFTVALSGKQPGRSPGEIVDLIEKSKLSNSVKKKSVTIFNRLAQAEADAHGEPIEKVHFHEVGALDAIIDICGAVAGLEMMGIDKTFSSPLVLGTGKIKTDHGLMPVPSPATAELVKNIPVRMTDTESELTTPTGAAILTTLAEFSKPRSFAVETVGYGAGSRDLPGLPNLLRIMIGDEEKIYESENIVVMETNLDRATPEMLGGLLENLIEGGALDAYITPIVMKKSRPGHMLTVLCLPDQKDALAKLIYFGGLTLGIRERTVARTKLNRREIKVTTSGGIVSVKIGVCDGREIVLPEYDDISAAMSKTGRSYDDIFHEIKDELRKEQ